MYANTKVTEPTDTQSLQTIHTSDACKDGSWKGNVFAGNFGLTDPRAVEVI
jgi:hypothetical protein